uniref:Uncharacterized protein n=2 Tax=Caenorhabditis japonica TaxID=281687 RepID=A0A8R1HMN8_CAEJA
MLALWCTKGKGLKKKKASSFSGSGTDTASDDNIAAIKKRSPRPPPLCLGPKAESRLPNPMLDYVSVDRIRVISIECDILDDI